MKGFKQGAQVPEGLVEQGRKLGFKYGGQVKDTSGEFVMTTNKQDPMDPGVQPARKGRTQQEIEAGGQPKLRPKFAEGGEAKKNPYKKGTARYKLWMRKHLGAQYTEREAEAMEKKDEGMSKKAKKVKGKSAKYMEEHGIKKGGRMKKKYMKEGHASTANKEMPSGVKKRGGLAHASKHKHGGPYKSEPMYGKD